MAAPSLLVEFAALWGLDAAEIGWLGGVYFAGYAAALPFIMGAAGRMDGRLVYAVAAGIGAAASLAFALLADGYWTALCFRLVAGAGFAGVHIIGMKLMADRLEGEAQARASAVFTGAFAVGSGLSYLAAGYLGDRFGWESVFAVAALGSAASILLLAWIGPPPAGGEARSTRFFPDFGAALRDREVMRYVIAYGGNLWEVFAIRVWFVPFLAFNIAAAGEAGDAGDVGGGWPPTTLAALSVFVAVPMNLLVAELGVRWGRRRAIFAVSVASICVCLLLGLVPRGPYEIVAALLLLHALTSFGDVGAIAGGVVRSTTAETRAAALALFGLVGFTLGFLGPLGVGFAIALSGGVGAPFAWLAGFAVMAIGSVLSAWAMTWRARPA